IWDLTRGQRLRLLSVEAIGELRLVFSPDGKHLAVANSGRDRDRYFSVPSASGEVRIWDVATGKEREQPQGYHGLIGTLAWSPHGRSHFVVKKRESDRWLEQYKLPAMK